jgi:Asp-tRNA(Asn)/Glu-tRNA(Gln) amidotransferase B subunit
VSILILIFILWLQYEIRKGQRLSKKSLELFWQKENDSNSTRRKDISQMDYLIVNLEELPMQDHDDDTINSYRDTIRRLAENKMINLAGLTNTELKLKYGVANFNLLSTYDNHYTAFVSMLQKWAERLKLRGHDADAQAVLEYSVFSCKTDVTKAYRMLAKMYQEQNSPDKINTLIDLIPSTRIKEPHKLIEELSTLSK